MYRMMLLTYISKYSFNKDEIIDLFISGNKGICKIDIINFFNNKNCYSTSCEIRQQNSPILCFAEGCEWNFSIQLELDKLNLESDLYVIKCSQDNNVFYTPFIVLNTDKKNDIVVVVNTNTWNAYNEYGQASFYSINGARNIGVIDERSNCIYNKSENGIDSSDIPCESAVVSFDRPFTRIDYDIKCFLKEEFQTKGGEAGAHLFYSETFLWCWLKKHNYNFDFITDQDLENYDLLKDRKIIMLNSHPEYWSHKMYYNLLKSFDEFNTNLIYLGGNAIWRKVYFNKEKNRIEKMGCPYHYTVLNNYKNPFSVDEFAKNNPVEIPPFVILGVFYNSSHIPFIYEDFKCIDNNCWVFKDTNFKIGDIIGKENCGSKPAGNENDYYTNNPLLDKDTKNKYFKEIKVLGRSKHDLNYSEIVLQKYKNSHIFSCGSIPFTRCINDPQVTIMLKNVIEKFLG